MTKALCSRTHSHHTTTTTPHAYTHRGTSGEPLGTPLSTVCKLLLWNGSSLKIYSQGHGLLTFQSKFCLSAQDGVEVSEARSLLPPALESPGCLLKIQISGPHPDLPHEKLMKV